MNATDSAGEGGLRLALHPRTRLVTLDFVRAAWGLEVEGVWACLESGRLRWVWDISRRAHGCGAALEPGVRELRVWALELTAPEWCHRLADEQVLEAVLGTGPAQWRAAEVAHWLLCSRAALKRLVDAGELAGPMRGRTRWITRPSLSAFLRRRRLV